MKCSVCGNPAWDRWKISSLKRPLCWHCYFERCRVQKGQVAPEAIAAWDREHPTRFSNRGVHPEQREIEFGG